MKSGLNAEPIMERAAVLKTYEADCYGICLYLLQDEEKACRAAQETLLQLIRCEPFFAAEPSMQRMMLCKISLKSALSIRYRD